MRKELLSQNSFLYTIGTFFCAIIFLSNWPIYNNSVNDGAIPLFYFASLLIIVLPILALHPVILFSTMDQSLSKWFAIYVILGTIWLLFSLDLKEANDQWRLRILSFYIIYLSFIFLSRCNLTLISKFILFLAFSALIFNWIDFVRPYTFIPRGIAQGVAGRGAGLFIDPNQSAYACLAMLIAIFPFIPKKYASFVIAIFLLGIFPTFSRAGWLWGVIVAGILGVAGGINRKHLFLIAILTPFLAFVGTYLLNIGLESGSANIADLTDRLNFLSNSSDIYDDSANERRQVATTAWNMFVDSPFFGQGLGTTVSWEFAVSAHNMYLTFMAEQGAVGFLLYVSLIYLVTKSGLDLYRSSSTTDRIPKDIGLALILTGLSFAFVGLFSHTMLYEPQVLFTLAFLMTAASKFKKQ